jgi:hypothetical protein
MRDYATSAGSRSAISPQPYEALPPFGIVLTVPRAQARDVPVESAAVGAVHLRSRSLIQ